MSRRPAAAEERPHGRHREGGRPLAGVEQQQHCAPSAVWFMALLAACGGGRRWQKQLRERRCPLTSCPSYRRGRRGGRAPSGRCHGPRSPRTSASSESLRRGLHGGSGLARGEHVGGDSQDGAQALRRPPSPCWWALHCFGLRTTKMGGYPKLRVADDGPPWLASPPARPGGRRAAEHPTHSWPCARRGPAGSRAQQHLEGRPEMVSSATCSVRCPWVDGLPWIRLSRLPTPLVLADLH